MLSGLACRRSRLDLARFRRHRGYGVVRHDTPSREVGSADVPEGIGQSVDARGRGHVGNTKVAAPLPIVDPGVSGALALESIGRETGRDADVHSRSKVSGLR